MLHKSSTKQLFRCVFCTLLALLATQTTAFAKGERFDLKSFSATINGTNKSGGHPELTLKTEFNQNDTYPLSMENDDTPQQITATLPEGLTLNGHAIEHPCKLEDIGGKISDDPHRLLSYKDDKHCPKESQVGWIDVHAESRMITWIPWHPSSWLWHFSWTPHDASAPVYVMDIWSNKLKGYVLLFTTDNITFILPKEQAATGLPLFYPYDSRLFLYVDVNNSKGHRQEINSLGFVNGANTAGDENHLVTTSVQLRLGSKDTFGGQHGFVSLPSRCDKPATTTLEAKAYSGRTTSGESSFAISDCSTAAFDPKVDLSGRKTPIPDPDEKIVPTTNKVDTPSPYDFTFTIPRSNKSADTRSRSTAAGFTITLPKSTRLNPGMFRDVDICTPTEFNPMDLTKLAKCPINSRIGTVTIDSEELNQIDPNSILGRVYLGQVVTKPTDQTLAIETPIYLEPYEYGFLQTRFIYKAVGQLKIPKDKTQPATITFTKALPDFPWDKTTLHFARLNGRSILVNPPTCGLDQTGNVDFTPWQSSPFFDPIYNQPSKYFFRTSWDGKGADCPPQRAFTPHINSFKLDNETASAKHDWVEAEIKRDPYDDGMKNINLKLPAGLTFPELTTIAPPCSENNISFEICPKESMLGTFTADVGFADETLPITGKVISSQIAGPTTLDVKLKSNDLNTTEGKPIGLDRLLISAQLKFNPITSRLELSTTKDLPRTLNEIPIPIQTFTIHLQHQNGNIFINPTTTNPRTIDLTTQSNDGRTHTNTQKWNAK